MVGALGQVMFERLGQVFRGERSLGETYWLWFIVPQIPIAIAIVVITVTSLSLMQISPQLFYGLFYGAFALGLVVLLFSGFSVFQSAFKSSQSTFWSVVAMIIVAGNIIFGGVRVSSLLLGTFHVSDADQVQAMQMLNLQLPRKIDSITTLAHIELKDHVMTYTMEIDAAYANRVAASAARSVIRPKVCQLFVTAFRKMEVRKVVYQYSSGGEKLFNIALTPADCA